MALALSGLRHDQSRPGSRVSEPELVAVETLKPGRAYTRKQLRGALRVAWWIRHTAPDERGRFVYVMPPETR